MSLIDEIRENAKNGTMGWRHLPDHQEGDPATYILSVDNFDVCTIWSGYRAGPYDANRIAAVPRMEAALLAAEEIAESFAARLDGEGGTQHEYEALAAFREACK